MGMRIKAGKHDEREPLGGTFVAVVTAAPERAGEGLVFGRVV
jgi:hypothetical protein